MGEIWLISLEQLAWPMLTSGSGPRVLVGASMLIAAYGGPLAAIARGVTRPLVRRPAPPPRPRRRPRP